MNAPAFSLETGLVLVLASVFTIALVSPAASQEPTVPDAVTLDTVALGFGWPVGTEARVSYARVIEREEGAPPESFEIEGEYVMHVHPHPSGLVVEHLDPLATRFVSTPALDPADPRRAVWSTIGWPLADWVVSADGALVGLTGEDALAGLLAAALQPLGLDEAGIQTALTELMGPQLLGTARDLWRAMVAAWAETELVVGESVATTSDDSNPLVPSVVLPYRHEYTLIGMEACPLPGGRCARLQVISFPDPREFTRVMSDALQEMGLTSMSFERLLQLTMMTVVADPATLLPHRVETSKRVDGILLDDGERQVFRRLDETRLVFTY